MLIVFFITGILIKLCEPDVTPVLADMSNSCYSLLGLASPVVATAIMMGAGSVVLLVPLGMLIQKMVAAGAVPTLRDAATMQPPPLLLGKGERYHLFLSHMQNITISNRPLPCCLAAHSPCGWQMENWARSVRGHQAPAPIAASRDRHFPRRAAAGSRAPSPNLHTLSGIRLPSQDVDDLQDISDLEGYVRATSVMLLFVSKLYFISKNCLREIRASLEQDKPLVLVHEQQEDKGGGPLEEIMNECHSQEMRAKIFDSRTPITWHRVPVCKTATSGPGQQVPARDVVH